jgi:predicted enzyme related to lactoylglutathione lyase
MKLLRRRLALAGVVFAGWLEGGAAELRWPELLTSGVPSDLASFYADTFGWKAERRGDSARAGIVLLRSGSPVAGIAYHPGEPMAKPRARWIGFFAVNEIADAEKAVLAAGGAVVSAGHVGAADGTRQGLLADGEGTVFGVVAGPGEAARGVWPVLLARHTAGAGKFLGAVFGGELRPEARTPLFAGDFLLVTGDRAWAGIQPTGVAGRTGWVLLFSVADIDETVKRAKRAGGRVWREPIIDMIGGRVAVIEDPAGGVFGLSEAIPVRAGRSARIEAPGGYEVEALSK